MKNKGSSNLLVLFFLSWLCTKAACVHLFPCGTAICSDSESDMTAAFVFLLYSTTSASRYINGNSHWRTAWHGISCSQRCRWWMTDTYSPLGAHRGSLHSLGASSEQRRCAVQTGIIDLTWLDSSWFRLLCVLVALSTSSTSRSTVKLRSIWTLRGLPDSFMNQNLSACCVPATLARARCSLDDTKNPRLHFDPCALLLLLYRNRYKNVL